MTGDLYTPTWWRGDLLRERAEAMGPAITRFAPGRHGTGLTDDLEVVADRLAKNNIIAYDHHYGLWYDRRRDDHLMVAALGVAKLLHPSTNNHLLVPEKALGGMA